MEATEVIKVLARTRIPVDTENAAQSRIEVLLKEAGLPYQREYVLDRKNRPDFFIEGLVVEVKIRGTNTSREIYRQLERYAAFEQVKGILLVTGKATGMPAEINGKPVTMMSLGRGWL